MMGQDAEHVGEHVDPRYAYRGKPGYGQGIPWHQRRTTWTTRDGQVIKLKDLKDSHLENILAFLRRRAANAHIRLGLDKLQKAILWSFDGIPDDVIDDMTRWDEDRSDEELLAELPVYRALCREADRRAELQGFVPARGTPVYQEAMGKGFDVFNDRDDDYMINDGGWGD